MKPCPTNCTTLQVIPWGELRVQDPETAADALRGILEPWDGIEEKAFAVRGMVALIMEERELWKLHTDPDTEQPFASLDQWFRKASPKSHSSWRDALRTIRELRDTPFEELVNIKRCTLEQLKKVSTNVRKKAAVLKAAKTLPEKEFVAFVNEYYPDQHLETKKPVVLAPEGDTAEQERAIEMAMLCDDCETRAEAIKAIYVAYIQTNSALYETLKRNARKTA